jgi:hypothetical protein
MDFKKKKTSGTELRWICISLERKLAKIHSDVGCSVELLLFKNSKGDQV